VHGHNSCMHRKINLVPGLCIHNRMASFVWVKHSRRVPKGFLNTETWSCWYLRDSATDKSLWCQSIRHTLATQVPSVLIHQTFILEWLIKKFELVNSCDTYKSTIKSGRTTDTRFCRYGRSDISTHMVNVFSTYKKCTMLIIAVLFQPKLKCIGKFQ
jgi:hypothetical protein